MQEMRQGDSELYKSFLTADVSKISETAQRDLIFILNVCSESGIHFA